MDIARKLVDAGNRDAIVDALSDLGLDRVSTCPPDRAHELLAKLKEAAA